MVIAFTVLLPEPGSEISQIKLECQHILMLHFQTTGSIEGNIIMRVTHQNLCLFGVNVSPKLAGQNISFCFSTAKI